MHCRQADKWLDRALDEGLPPAQNALLEAHLAACPRCRLLVDNTFATPILCRPLALGADLVMESVSKMMNGAAKTVLVVEDRPDVRKLTGRLLSHLGYQVVEAHDGSSALSLLRQRHVGDVLAGHRGAQLVDLVTRALGEFSVYVQLEIAGHAGRIRWPRAHVGRRPVPASR